VSSLPLIYVRVKQNFRLNTLQYLKHIVGPFTLPYLLAGGKTGIGFSWMAVIAAEMISANSGLGYFIEINRVMLNPERVIAAMLVIGLIGYCLHQAILLLEKRLTGWRCTAHE
jgi:ABC-type nitrate/sulfonate/bicarbonate transport system permease component